MPSDIEMSRIAVINGEMELPQLEPTFDAKAMYNTIPSNTNHRNGFDEFESKKC